MTCSELNFVSSQCFYAVCIAYPNMPEDEQIDKARRCAVKIIERNYGGSRLEAAYNKERGEQAERAGSGQDSQ